MLPDHSNNNKQREGKKKGERLKASLQGFMQITLTYFLGLEPEPYTGPERPGIRNCQDILETGVAVFVA